MKVWAKCAQGVLILVTALVGWWIGQRQTLFAVVRGNSMEPTLRSGQWLRLHHSLPRAIPRGTVVLVSEFPLPPFVKRVVGLPHETVSFRLGEVFIDGKMLREEYLPAYETTFSWTCDRLAARDDEYVVLGDNRLSSEDSREYGVIPRDRILAIVEVHSAPSQLLEHPCYRITKDGEGPPPRIAIGNPGAAYGSSERPGRS